jgi:hypothetical protein
MAVCLSTMFLLVYISVSSVTAAYGSALTAGHFFQTPECRPSKKVTKKARPKRPAPRLGSAFLRCGIPPGTSLPVCCAAPPLDVCGFAARRCAPTPRMNASTQPAEGAGGSKAKAKAKALGELTLGLVVWWALTVGASLLAKAADLTMIFAAVPISRWELACQRWRPDSRPCCLGCTYPLLR